MQLKFMMRVHFQRDFTEQLVKLVSLLRARQQMQAVRDRFRSIHAKKPYGELFVSLSFKFYFSQLWSRPCTQVRAVTIEWVPCSTAFPFLERTLIEMLQFPLWEKCSFYWLLNTVYLLRTDSHTRFSWLVLDWLWSLQNVPTSSFTSLKA